MIEIVVPMAGRGSRFAAVGYRSPKPLIDVLGKPMIERVIENLRPSRPHRFTFVVLREHVETLGVRETLERCAPGCTIVPIDEVTEGAACTVLLAEHAWSPSSPLLIANSDQWVDGGIDPFLEAWASSGADGFVMTMTADDPKWSYVELDERGGVIRLVEKEVVSNEATVGIYAFARAEVFGAAARTMIAAEDRVNGEFYVAPTYNYVLRDHYSVGWFNVGSEGNGMYGLGTPGDLGAFAGLAEAGKIEGLTVSEART